MITDALRCINCAEQHSLAHALDQPEKVFVKILTKKVWQ